MVTMLANQKWGEDLTIQMINEYEKREYLWNPMSPDYKNKRMREQGYLEIIRDLDLVDVSVKELKNKIKNIRSSYSVELKKIRAARKGTEAISKNSGGVSGSPHTISYTYRPSVTWFEHADRFLRAIVTPSSIDASLLDIHASDDDAAQDLSERKSPEKKYVRKRRNSNRSTPWYVLKTPTPRKVVQYNLTPSAPSGPYAMLTPNSPNCMPPPPVGVATPLTPSTSSLASIYPIPPKQKKGDANNLSHLDVPQDLSQHIIAEPNENEFEMFGKLIASQLRKLPLSLALDTQLKIQTLVNAARIQAVYQQYGFAAQSHEADPSVLPMNMTSHSSVNDSSEEMGKEVSDDDEN